MQRTEEHVVAVIEDIEAAIARVHIHIQKRDLVPLPPQVMRRDGGVVEEAEPVGTIFHRMMARRAAQPKSRACAVHHVLCGSKRRLCRPVDRLVCILCQRR